MEWNQVIGSASEIHMETYMKIEDNLSDYSQLKAHLTEVQKSGSLSRFCACHNFFPHNDTGLDYDQAVRIARTVRESGCETGIFIGSESSSHDVGGTQTDEEDQLFGDENLRRAIDLVQELPGDGGFRKEIHGVRKIVHAVRGRGEGLVFQFLPELEFEF